MGTNRNLLPMGTPEMENFMVSFSTHGVHPHHQRRNTQQFRQGLIRDFLEILQADSFHGLGCILYKRNEVLQQFHGKTSSLGLSHVYLYRSS